MSKLALHHTYQTLQEQLSPCFNQREARIDLETVTGRPVEVRNYSFVSANADVHPKEDYAQTDPTARALITYYLKQNPYSAQYIFGSLQSADRNVEENRRFPYSVFAPRSDSEAPSFKRGTLLLHGLNEKSWQKYLPWAFRLVELTARPVILFPIAFHMNRAPASWASPREMIQVARERQRLFGELSASSFANAALSHRLQFAPHRFLTSGLQSYYDLSDLAGVFASGEHELFEEGSELDLFGYSAGATLAEMLLMGNPKGRFARSRGFLLCGGAVMDQVNPVSKAIMDGEAHRELSSFLQRLAERPETVRESGIAPEIEDRPELGLLRSLLLTDRLRALRERVAAGLKSRLRIVSMVKDRVFSPEGVRRSWQNREGAPILEVETVDPDYEYSHEQPFPL
ncbi:MAG: DUF6051 family protein, partial [Spirochaetaceae bacterium]